jgi:hypothetical protein
MSAVAIVVDWFGPFTTLKAARTQIGVHQLDEGLYLAIGRGQYKTQFKHKADLQYVGISKAAKGRLHNDRFPEIKRDRTFRLWLGRVSSHAVAGRKELAHSTTVHAAEWATAFFLQLHLNKRCRKKPPPRSLVLINRWFKSDFGTRRVHRGHSEWPDMIEYDKLTNTARIAWLGAGGEMWRLDQDDVMDLRLAN